MNVDRKTVTDFVTALGLNPGMVSWIRIQSNEIHAEVYGDEHATSFMSGEAPRGLVRIHITDGETP